MLEKTELSFIIEGKESSVDWGWGHTVQEGKDEAVMSEYGRRRGRLESGHSRIFGYDLRL